MKCGLSPVTQRR